MYQGQILTSQPATYTPQMPQSAQPNCQVTPLLHVGSRSTIQWLFLKAVALVCLVMIVSCSHPKNASRIPARATAVVKVDLGSIAFKSVSWSDIWKQLQKSDATDPKDSTAVFAADISKSGLSLTDPVYLYVMPTGLTDGKVSIISVSLSSATDFKTYLETQKWITRKPAETSGTWSAAVGQDIDIVWNNEQVLLALKDASSKADYTNQLRDQLNTSEKESLIGSSIIFKQTEDEKADMSYYVRSALVPSQENSADEIYGHVTLEDGKFGIKGAQVGKTGRLTNQGLYSAKTKPNFWAGCPIDKPSLVMAMAIEPDTLLQIANANPGASAFQTLNSNLNAYETNVGELLQLWDGQIGVMGYVPQAADGWLMSSKLAIRLGVRDQMMLGDILKRLVDKEVLTQLEPNVFGVSIFPIRITQLEDHMTLTYNVEKLVENGKVAKGPWQSVIEGHTFGMWMDPAPLASLVGQFSSNTDSLQKYNPMQEIQMVSDLDASDGRMNYGMDFVMKEKKQNAARSLLMFMSYANFNRAQSAAPTEPEPSDDEELPVEPNSDGLPSSGGPTVRSTDDNG